MVPYIKEPSYLLYLTLKIDIDDIDGLTVMESFNFTRFFIMEKGSSDY